MSNELALLDSNFNELKKHYGVNDTRFYIGEINETTPETFAAEANIIMQAYLSEKVVKINHSCKSIN